jgi:hypothetical protein
MGTTASDLSIDGVAAADAIEPESRAVAITSTADAADQPVTRHLKSPFHVRKISRPRPAEERVERPSEGKRRVARNLAALSGGQAVTSTFTLIWTLIIARAIGPVGFGILVSAQAVSGVLGIALGIGARDYLVREIVATPAVGPRLIGTVIALRIALAPVVALAAVVWARLAHYGHDATIVLYLITAMTIFIWLLDAVQAAFRAIERMTYIAYGNVVSKAAQSTTGIALVVVGFDGVGIAADMAIIVGLVVLLSWSWLRPYFRIDLRTNVTLIARVAKERLVYWAAGVFWTGGPLALAGGLVASRGIDRSMMEQRREFDVEVRRLRPREGRRPRVLVLLALACAAVLLPVCGGSAEAPAASLLAAPPVHLYASTTGSAVVLHWSSLPLAGRTGYYIIKDGARQANVAANSYTFTKLTCATTHTLGVQAHDASGNTGHLYTTRYTTPRCRRKRYRLPPSRTVAWTPGLNAVGGIPARTSVYKTISPSGGDDTARIQAALGSCPKDGVVQLTAGVFHLDGPPLLMENSYCVLRGAGPGPGNWLVGTPASGTGGTYLEKPSGTNSAVVKMGSPESGIPVSLTSDAVRGKKSVTVADASGLAAGDLIVVDELTDPNISHWNSGNPENNSGGFEQPNRPLGDTMEVASVSGNTVTFTTAFPITYHVSRSAHFYKVSNTTRETGVEDLYFYGGEGGDQGGGVHMYGCAYCWVKHVEGAWTGEPINIDAGFRDEIRDSFFHDAQGGLNAAASSYGISLGWYTSGVLSENNIVIRFNKVDVLRSAGGDNVFGYNYMDDGADKNGNWVENQLDSTHMTTPHYELFEGNEAPNATTGNTWGNAVYSTYFRNHLTGFLRDFPSSGPQTGAGPQAGDWWFSFVGNVLGTSSNPGVFTNYELLGTQNFPDHYVWGMCNEGQADNGKCLSTTLRDGNFDYLTGRVHWHGVGGTGAKNGLTPPADSTLPASMYLTAKPGFFGSNPWPWVDGSNAANPLPGKLPARVRYDAGTPNRVQ